MSNRQGDAQPVPDAGRSVLLVSMPFASACRPSLALGALAAYLKGQGIPVEAWHAGLSCAERFGLDAYERVAREMGHELFYPFYLYPEHAAAHRRAIVRAVGPLLGGRRRSAAALLDAALEALRAFHDELLAGFDPARFGLAGFSVTYDQLRPSLYLARLLKARAPELPVVFGGAQCIGDAGKSLLATFQEIDYVIMGEGEAPLAALVRHLDGGDPGATPALAWRGPDGVRVNAPGAPLEPEALPVPDYDAYFERLERSAPAVRESVRAYLSLPVETARGCWWRRCTFCNLNASVAGYRCKDAPQAAAEIRTLVERHRCQTVCVVDNVQRTEGFAGLMRALRDLDMNLDIFMEIRAGLLRRPDFELMRDAGVKTVQIGVEAFGRGMLDKIRKGVSVIDNIAAIKHCQAYGIYPFYNVIVDYPNEEDADIAEAAAAIRPLSGLMPPSALTPMWLGYGSPIFEERSRFNIRAVRWPEEAALVFPPCVRRTLVPWRHAYTWTVPGPDRREAWRTLFMPWQRQAGQRLVGPLLFYQRAPSFATLTDLRSGCARRVTLTPLERDLYAYGDEVRTLDAVAARFPERPCAELEAVIDRFVAQGWMFREGNRVLSLGVRLDPALAPLAYRAGAEVGQDPLLHGWSMPTRERRWVWRVGNLAQVSVGVVLERMPRRLARRRARRRRDPGVA